MSDFNNDNKESVNGKDSNENNNNNENENKKEDSTKFAHLNNASKVVPTKRKKGLLGMLTGGVVVIFIFMMMISGGHHKKVLRHEQQQATNNDLVIKKNVARLNALQNQSNNPGMNSNGSIGFASNTENKEMIARRNSPTQMYASAGYQGISSQTGQQDGNNSKIMAGNDESSKFANSQSSTAVTVSGVKIRHPRFTVAEGELIPATLETAINSDLPGMLRAVTTRPIYAYTGEKPLIPAGSRLIGQYSSLANNGAATNRILIIWNRVITPQGISIIINSPGTDSLGRAGIGADAVDSHFLKIFGTATLLSIMAATTATNGVSSYDQPNSSNMYRQSIAESFQEAAQATLRRNLSIKPTLHVHQGDSINVFVAKDLDLYSALANI